MFIAVKNSQILRICSNPKFQKLAMNFISTGNLVLTKNTDIVFKKLLTVMKSLKYDEISKLSKGSNMQLASLKDYSSGQQ